MDKKKIAEEITDDIIQNIKANVLMVDEIEEGMIRMYISKGFEKFHAKLREELPTDEEIKAEIFKDDPVKDGDNEWLYGYRQGRFSGAKRLRNRLQGGK